eukprot:jgi/Bigna1/66737/fgenesh1_pg.2_\
MVFLLPLLLLILLDPCLTSEMNTIHIWKDVGSLMVKFLHDAAYVDAMWQREKVARYPKSWLRKHQDKLRKQAAQGIDWEKCMKKRLAGYKTKNKPPRPSTPPPKSVAHIKMHLRSKRLKKKRRDALELHLKEEEKQQQQQQKLVQKSRRTEEVKEKRRIFETEKEEEEEEEEEEEPFFATAPHQQRQQPSPPPLPAKSSSSSDILVVTTKEKESKTTHLVGYTIVLGSVFILGWIAGSLANKRRHQQQ